MPKPMTHTEGEPTTAINVAVLAALLLLLAATIGLALIDVDRYLPGHCWALPLALAVAALKGALVVGYFMHVRYGNGLVRSASAAGFVWLGILLVITLLEVITRQQAHG